MANSDCKKILNLIPLYVDQMLSEEETDIVSRHLEICEDCKKELDFMKSMQKTAAALPDIEPSCDFHKNLMEKAQRAQRAKKARKFIILRRAGTGVAAAAVVVLCLVNFANIDNTRISTHPDQHATPATDISQNPVSLTAPTPEDLSAPEKSTAAPQPDAAHTNGAHTEQAPTAPEKPNAPSGGGGSAKSPDYADEGQIPSMLSADEAYTVATVTVTDEIRDTVTEILSSYEKDEKGYKVSDINAVLRQLAELGATVEAVADNAASANYIIVK